LLSCVYFMYWGVSLEVLWISNNKHFHGKIYKVGTVGMSNFLNPNIQKSKQQYLHDIYCSLLYLKWIVCVCSLKLCKGNFLMNICVVCRINCSSKNIHNSACLTIYSCRKSIIPDLPDSRIRNWLFQKKQESDQNISYFMGRSELQKMQISLCMFICVTYQMSYLKFCKKCFCRLQFNFWFSPIKLLYVTTVLASATCMVWDSSWEMFSKSIIYMCNSKGPGTQPH
jgi:hypothetical protein